MQLTAGVRKGDILAGKYRVERVLGAGGMGVVVAAHHLQLDEKVAIKFLLPDMVSNADAVGRFAREARVTIMGLSTRGPSQPHCAARLDRT